MDPVGLTDHASRDNHEAALLKERWLLTDFVLIVVILGLTAFIICYLAEILRPQYPTGELLRHTCCHEAGHAVVNWHLTTCDKITVLKIGRWKKVNKSQVSSRSYCRAVYWQPRRNDAGSIIRFHHEQLMAALGGEIATEMMLRDYASCEVTLVSKSEQPDHSDLLKQLEVLVPHARYKMGETARNATDEEISAVIVADATAKVKAILEANRDKLERLAAALKKKLKLNEKEIAAILGSRRNFGKK